MDQFAQQCQSQPLPPPSARPTVHTAAVAAPLSEVSPHPALLPHPFMLLYGGHPYYQPPPHFLHPSHPPSPYGSGLPPSQVFPAPLAVPKHQLFQSGPAVSPAPVPPETAVSAIAAAFTEYQNLDKPRYYNLPPGYSSDPGDAGLWTLDDEVAPTPASISAVDFVSSDSGASRLVLTLTLWVGKRAVAAKALIDSGSEGDFVDSTFAH